MTKRKIGEIEELVPKIRKDCANERERGRTQSVNGAFAHLRGLIPTEPLDRKLSKIETLRLATSYIEHLASQLNAEMLNETPCLVRSSPSNNKRSICTFCLANVKRGSISTNYVQEPSPSTHQPHHDYQIKQEELTQSQQSQHQSSQSFYSTDSIFFDVL